MSLRPLRVPVVRLSSGLPILPRYGAPLRLVPRRFQQPAFGYRHWSNADSWEPRATGNPRKLEWIAALVVVLVAVAGSPSRVSAQVLYGSIVGNVHDSTGAILPGATVTILHEETKLSFEAQEISVAAKDR